MPSLLECIAAGLNESVQDLVGLTDLQNQVNALEATYNNFTAQIAAESTQRQLADNNFAGQLSTLSANITAVQSSLSAAIVTFNNDYAAVNGLVSANRVDELARLTALNSALTALTGRVTAIEAVNVDQQAQIHQPGIWQTPTLAGGWHDYGAPWAGLQYRKQPNNIVAIKGFIAAPGGSSTALDLFTLQPGYWPPDHERFIGWSSTGSVEIQVHSDGVVHIANADITGTSLSGITFVAP